MQRIRDAKQRLKEIEGQETAIREDLATQQRSINRQQAEIERKQKNNSVNMVKL